MSVEVEYYREHMTKIEESLAKAVETAISEQHNDPVLLIAELLKQQSESDQYKSAREASDGRASQTWQAKKWLNLLPLTKILADMLQRPLREIHPDDSGPELAFVQAYRRLRRLEGAARHPRLEGRA